MNAVGLYKRVPKKATYAGKEYTLKVYEDTTDEQIQTALEVVYGPVVAPGPLHPTMFGPNGTFIEAKINNPYHPFMVEAIDLVYNWRDYTPKPRVR